jgi:hypothetical protein
MFAFSANTCDIIHLTFGQWGVFAVLDIQGEPEITDSFLNEIAFQGTVEKLC